MEHLRVRMKYGEHEFEAEGPGPDVHTELALFTELIRPPSATERPRVPEDGPVALQGEQIAQQDERIRPPGDRVTPQEPDITRLMRLEGRIVSFATVPRSVEEGILLALLSQKLLRDNDKVMGGEIIGGIRQSGRPVYRVDYHTHRLIDAGDVVATGRGRAARYRLTAAGHAKAEALARAALAAPGAMA